MGPWQIATLCIVALAGLVAVVRLTRNPGTRAAPRSATLDATPAGWGSMTPGSDPHAASVALRAAQDPFDGLPPWARPSYPRQAPFGWESGAGTARPGGGWDFHEWDPWDPDPSPTRLANTDDLTLTVDVAADIHRRAVECEVWSALRAEQWASEMAASR